MFDPMSQDVKYCHCESLKTFQQKSERTWVYENFLVKYIAQVRLTLSTKVHGSRFRSKTLLLSSNFRNVCVSKLSNGYGLI